MLPGIEAEGALSTQVPGVRAEGALSTQVPGVGAEGALSTQHHSRHALSHFRHVCSLH